MAWLEVPGVWQIRVLLYGRLGFHVHESSAAYRKLRIRGGSPFTYKMAGHDYYPASFPSWLRIAS